jgi:hypothetical protein
MVMINEQTAMNWFIDQLPIRILNAYSNEIEKALKIEEEQLNQACYDGYYQEEPMDTRQYFNKTYSQEPEYDSAGFTVHDRYETPNQTSVEWLKECLSIHLTDEQKQQFEGLFQQALATDKEQKKFMFDCGRQYQLTGEGTFTQVYQETYEGGQDE